MTLRRALRLAALCLPVASISLLGMSRPAAAQVPGADPAGPAELPAEPPAEPALGPVPEPLPFAPIAVGPAQNAAEQMWVGPFRPAEPASELDPLIPTAIAELVAAGAMLALGGVLWGTAVGDERCGAIAGCIQVLSDAALARREAGVAMVGLGAGFAMFGGLSLGLLAADPLESEEARDAPGAAVTGHLLFAAGLSTFAAGFVYGAAADPRTIDYERPWPFYLLGLTATAVGIPLFVAGVSRETEHERLQERLRSRRGSKTRPSARPTAIAIGPTGGAATWAW